MRIVFALVVVSAAILAIGVRSAAACSCAPTQTPCAAAQSGGVIFVGTVVSAAPIGGDARPARLRFKLNVQQAIVGAADQTISVETAADTGTCGFPFQVGVSYLVYAGTTASGYVTSMCSRTGRVEDRQNDLKLLEEVATGHVRSRLAVRIARFELDLDGFYMHGNISGAVPDVPVSVKGNGQTYRARTDKDGQLTLTDLAPGSYVIEPQLPANYRFLFDRPIEVPVNGCLAETDVVTAVDRLSGVATNADGSFAGAQIMLRAARLDSSGAVAFSRTTLAFTDAEGRWKLPGLPPGRYLLGVNTFDAPSATTPYPTTWFPNATHAADAEVIVVSDKSPRTIEFQLPHALAAVSIAGHVVDASGRPVTKASIMLYDDDDPHAVVSWKSNVGFANTDEQGQFKVTGFRGRKYHIRANVMSMQGGAESALVPVTTDAPAPTVTLIIPKP